MGSLAIRDRSHVPPGGGFTYTQPESGVAFRHHSLDALFGQVKKHRLANNYPVGSNFRGEIEAAICEAQPDICGDFTPPEPMTKAKLLLQFAKALLGWAADGCRVVGKEQFAARWEICTGCPYWGGDGAAFGLGRCGKCGCSGLKLHAANERCPIGKWESL